MAGESTQPLRVETARQEAYSVVVPIGEVDIASVPLLEETLSTRLDAGELRLIVDLEQLDYLDSTGLGCVTAARRRAKDLGGDLVLVCTRDRLLRLFTITGLDNVFTICASRAEAAAKLGEGDS